MSKKLKKPAPKLERLELPGLEPAPAQAWSGVRLVPLMRSEVGGDLRLALKSYGEDATVVALSGQRPLEQPDEAYWSVRLTHRMRRREDGNRLRFLPLHMAMEGFLDLYFGGPDVAWAEFSRHALTHGLSPRQEISYDGRAIFGLEDALRVFEVHEGQCGVLVYVADTLASAFVVPHPEDYRLLHRTLIEDFYGELIFLNSHYAEENRLELPMAGDGAASVADLREALARMREHWAAFSRLMADGLLERPVNSVVEYSFGEFQMLKFVSDLRLKHENHIGEAILRRNGTVEYLKTYRLSAAQTRRAYLLSQLAGSGWNLEACAAPLGTSKEDLVVRLEKAGFAYLIHEHVLAAARKKLRRKR